MAQGTKSEIRPGVWRLRVFVGVDPTTGKRRQLSRTVQGGARHASQELARFAAEVQAGDVPAGPDQTLSEFLSSWLDFVESQRSPTTIRGYRDKVRRWNVALGQVRVSKLTAQDLDRTYARWLGEGASPATIRHCHRILATALKQGQRWGLVTSCVTDVACPPASEHRPPPDIDPVTWQAVVLDLKEREPVTAMAVLLAGVTGARRGELCGLRWSDVDWTRSMVMIARSIHHGLDKKELVVAPTKTGRIRRVSLDARTVALLDQYRSQASVWAEGAGVELAEDGYILTFDPSGQSPLKPDTITAGFSRAARRVGAKIRFHDLRHMSASLLIGAGTDARTVAGRLGHTDASTTLRIYAHAFEAQDRQAAEVLGALLPV
ncbi:site-specific integrase [Acidiferrimicrobium sp. IK]|uniref:tyrosine-type recombinase/integrase n=1 Tax=Acidiferrimicrobium sp. IK TaxID=2871700 RepID=UPI0021CB5344|nr:site-specific integrase [Acidiferrimicrobium sp. IK]MCU4185962.1 site-specific integrase [Acidiferrimicrobium sp. IK]